ncbi:hypothetical protein ACVCAH_36655 [Micromonospora sp. LZ34]
MSIELAAVVPRLRDLSGIVLPMSTAAGRRAAFGLVIVAPVPVAIGVFASVNPGRYIHLDQLAHPFLAVALSCGVLAAAGWLGFRGSGLRAGSQWLAAAVAAIALLIGGVGSVQVDPRGPVVASSPGHRLVAYEVMGGVAALRVQSRAGLLSREGRTELACFSWSSSNSAPDDLFNRAAFVGTHEVEVVTEDGQASRVRFDPQTLTPEATPDGCPAP